MQKPLRFNYMIFTVWDFVVLYKLTIAIRFNFTFQIKSYSFPWPVIELPQMEKNEVILIMAKHMVKWNEPPLDGNVCMILIGIFAAYARIAI